MEAVYTEPELRSLLERFHACELPKVEWTHAAHLAVGLDAVRRLGRPAALEECRAAIWRHNESVGTPNTDSEGYHETITAFWLWVAEKHLERCTDRGAEALATWIRADYGRSDFPLKYFSKKLLFSTEARREWCDPDLHPLTELLPNPSWNIRLG